ncbi:Tripartite tricarboxylate transporter TctB family protein [Franzmannia pantelleriensis]|uniref:Tripartite tricarboxylate transporter TctB family protein n=1 Tax=Franzmannia pantelleriensis TaxID=48727 RepID=A0A1G9XCN3_9GAMM|nr:tripartite tricarboxylate transporter TctB family protein [Halomonas pantelleriensis]SDM94562.1 Tripartite tricarboxylate transporter TctB family protein [Halomonas pantelleriensis]
MDRDIGKPLFDIFLLVASGIGFYYATTLPSITSAGGITPAFFPKLLSGLIFVCAVPCFIRDSLEWLSQRRERDYEAQNVRSDGPKSAVAQWLFIMALIIGYAIIFERLGYLVSTSLFCFLSVLGMVMLSGEFSGMSAVNKLKSGLGYLAFSIILSSSIFFVFTALFNIPLPN